jgi:glucosyltransferase
MDLISVIVPCYDEEESLPQFYNKVSQVLTDMEDVNYELLFINDGSKDDTLSLLKEFSASDERVNYISFSRNFGKEAAMYAGLREAAGDYVVIMDADLQHPPELLPQMYYALTEENFDCACARRTDREGEGRFRSFLSKKFYDVINKISDIKMVDGAGDYRMMSRQMTDSVLALSEYNRYSNGLFTFVGFETKMLTYHNVPRTAGRTKWSFFALLKYAMDGIISFSAVPLEITSVCGVISCIIAFIMGLYVGVKTLIFGNEISGWTTLVCIVLFIGGLQMLFLGIIGQYLSKTYMESKHRPIYIVRETNMDPRRKKITFTKSSRFRKPNHVRM